MPIAQTHSQDSVIRLHNKSWQDFEQMDRLFSEVKRRLSFYQGTIELRMPGQDHEVFSGIIAFLLGLYCLDKGIWFLPTGSFTQKKPPEAAAEADESYCFGSRKPIPDLAIEIIFTSGSESKLLKYQALGVLEVWFWEDGVFKLYRLSDNGYQAIQSSLIPGLEDLDIQLLSRCVLIAETDMQAAANELRKGI